jgi:hypothetical protein
MEDIMNKRIKRVYVNRCAVGMAFNPMFAARTRPFWESVRRGEIIAIVSDVLERELQKAPSRARELVYGLSESQIERVVSTEESNRLAGQYIAESEEFQAEGKRYRAARAKLAESVGTDN